ncbi:MAG: hypothetical protein DYG88_05425 [Chloroflexi bacterium CFX4]|nr:hypothetical protein [Chloroflexi bacterium CFX4]MDL1923981.1 2TM domain-containing protein [Chloroflexi bacterium CFX3]
MSRLDYEEVRRAAEKRVKKRTEFYQHLIAYVGVNLILIIASSGGALPVAFFWGIGLAFHAADVFLDDPLRRERAIRREMEKLGYTAADLEAEKPKRDRVALSEDGELIYEDEDNFDEEEVPRRKRQRD